jgi:hypothetical protein
MELRPPFAFLRDYATRWDAVALVIVIGIVAFLGAASRGLLAPLPDVGATLSLAPVHLRTFSF